MWEGETIEARATYVLHLERGEWKVVHVHWSLPQANLDVLGRSLTVTLEELEKTVQREQPDLSATLAADGTVTIAFTDIVDSTLMLGRLGDQAWLDVLRRHNAVIEEATTAHGGTVVETQGDGSMLAFSSARRAVACAVTIQLEIDRAFADRSPRFACESESTPAMHYRRPTTFSEPLCTMPRVSPATPRVAKSWCRV